MLSKNAIYFIEDLKNNNNTDWMHANKNRYESFKQDYHYWIDSILNEMKLLDPLLGVLETKNCTFRINRDIRFSKDKQPYKNNIAMWMSIDKNNKNGAGYYIHYEKDNCFIAGGVWCPAPLELKKIRNEIAFFNDDLHLILKDTNFVSQFGSLTADEKSTLKKAPKGFDEAHPAIELLKLKTYTASKKIENELFMKVDSSKNIAQMLKNLTPLNHFLNRALQTEQ